MIQLSDPIPVTADDPAADAYIASWLRTLLLTCQNLSLTQRDGAIQNYDKAGNLAAQYVIYTSNAVADTEDTVPHTLGYAPQNYIPVNRDKAGIVYDGATRRWPSSPTARRCARRSISAIWRPSSVIR